MRIYCQTLISVIQSYCRTVKVSGRYGICYTVTEWNHRDKKNKRWSHLPSGSWLASTSASSFLWTYPARLWVSALCLLPPFLGLTCLLVSAPQTTRDRTSDLGLTYPGYVSSRLWLSPCLSSRNMESLLGEFET